jgi:hypothetical protein
MATSFFDDAGRDLDDCFDLAPTEFYSIYNKVIGMQTDVNRYVHTNPETNQFVTNAGNGVTDLLKRYLWKGHGTVGTKGTGYYPSVKSMYYPNGSPNGSPQGGTEATSYLALKSMAATKGSSGGKPTFSPTSLTTNRTYTFPTLSGNVVTNVVFSNDQTRPAQVGSFPVTSYQVVGTPTIARTGGSSLMTGTFNGTPVVNSGGSITAQTRFQCSTNSSVTSTFTVVVRTRAMNVIGWSDTATTTFTISVTRNGSGNDL